MSGGGIEGTRVKVRDNAFFPALTFRWQSFADAPPREIYIYPVLTEYPMFRVKGHALFA